jgi:hypothetical protein
LVEARTDDGLCRFLQPPTVPDDKPVLDTAAPALGPAVVEAEAQPADVVSPTDKVEPVVQTEGATETATPPAPIAKETSVEDKKVEDKVAAAVPAGSSPKKVSRDQVDYLAVMKVSDYNNSV